MPEPVEERVRQVEDNVLLMHNDLKNIVVAITDVSASMKKLADIHTKQVLMEERAETRHNHLKAKNEEQDKRIDLIQGDLKKGVWVVITMFILGVGKMVMDGVK